MVNSGLAMDLILVSAPTSGWILQRGCARKEAKILDALGAILAFRLHINLPLAAKPVEIVDEVSAHEGLQGLVNLRQIHALLENPVPVHIKINLRHGRQKGRAHTGDFRSLLRRFHELVDVGGKKLRVLSTVFQGPAVNPPAVPTPAMAGGGKGEGNSRVQTG